MYQNLVCTRDFGVHTRFWYLLHMLKSLIYINISQSMRLYAQCISLSVNMKLPNGAKGLSFLWGVIFLYFHTFEPALFLSEQRALL